jgi:hypothetical protein
MSKPRLRKEIGNVLGIATVSLPSMTNPNELECHAIMGRDTAQAQCFFKLHSHFKRWSHPINVTSWWPLEDFSCRRKEIDILQDTRYLIFRTGKFSWVWWQFRHNRHTIQFAIVKWVFLWMVWTVWKQWNCSSIYISSYFEFQSVNIQKWTFPVTTYLNHLLPTEKKKRIWLQFFPTLPVIHNSYFLDYYYTYLCLILYIVTCLWLRDQ